MGEASFENEVERITLDELATRMRQALDRLPQPAFVSESEKDEWYEKRCKARNRIDIITSTFERIGVYTI